MAEYLLGFDVGGTNTRVGLYDMSLKLISKKVYHTKSVKSLDVLARSFRKYRITGCCIGFAGPVIGRKSFLTNGSLKIDADQFARSTGIKSVKLVNDFVAIGEGIRRLKSRELLAINAKKISNPVKLVIGPGTGLGKAYIINNKTYPTEGGLTTLGIENIEEYTLLDYLRKKCNSPVYYEDVVSGRGLIDLYDHLEIRNNLNIDMKVKRDIRKLHVKTADIITKNSKKDELCNMTLVMFTTFYARFARDAALHLLPSEILLCGGISPAIRDYIEKYFMKEFVRHRNYSSILRKIGVTIVLNTDAGLLGAASLARGVD